MSVSYLFALIIYITITGTWEDPDMIPPFEWHVLEGVGEKDRKIKEQQQEEREQLWGNTPELWGKKTILKILLQLLSGK